MPEMGIKGVHLYYELHGQNDDPVLVLNNGIIMNATSSWAFQTKALSAHYRLLQYDCRGQGKSDHPEGPYSMEIHADDLYTLLKSLNIKNAHIAGISYGGEVAQAFALKYPHKTRSLLLMDTVSEVGPGLHQIIQSWVDALRTGDSLAFFNSTVPWNFSAVFINRNKTLLEDGKNRYAELDFPAVIRLCDAFFKVDFTSHLQELKVPTCIMVGEVDLLKGLPYAEIIKKGKPHSELHILKGAGHASCWERPENSTRSYLGSWQSRNDICNLGETGYC